LGASLQGTSSSVKVPEICWSPSAKHERLSQSLARTGSLAPSHAAALTQPVPRNCCADAHSGSMPLASKARAAALSSQTHASVEMSRIARWSCGVARARTRGGPRQGSLWPVRAAGRREIGDGLQAEATRHRATAARNKARDDDEWALFSKRQQRPTT